MSDQKLQPKQRQEEAGRQVQDARGRLDIVDGLLRQRDSDVEYVLFLLAAAQSSMSRARSYCESLVGEED